MADHTTLLPPNVFDGMVFIDAYRIKWVYDGSTKCWMRVGLVEDLPVASDLQSGLLSSTLKNVIDNIPEGGGHFGIITKPLLSIIPSNIKPLLNGKVYKSSVNSSGSHITLYPSSNSDGIMEDGEYAGKLLVFKSGTLNNKKFLIYTNDESNIYVQGSDASQAKINDKFSIIEPSDFNPDGVLTGDIELVSDSLDISCVDSNGDPIENSNCNIVSCESDSQPPGLDISISESFLNEFCVQIPGCAGPRGDRGEKGDDGEHGTGDGPQGLKGDDGIPGPDVGDNFSGIKIVDTQDVYDTAVVGLELDAVNGKLNVVKAKIRTPNNNKPVQQLIASAVERGIEFTDTDFSYNLLMPTNDPINTEDVTVAHYPQGFDPANTTTGLNRSGVNIVKLGDFVDDIIQYYRGRLDEIGYDYDQKIKAYVESKDSEARSILSSLADEVARCEWNLSPEFCLGLAPDNCDDPSGETTPFPLAQQLLGPQFEGSVATPLPKKKVKPKNPPSDEPPPGFPPPGRPPGIPGKPGFTFNNPPPGNPPGIINNPILYQYNFVIPGEGFEGLPGDVITDDSEFSDREGAESGSVYVTDVDNNPLLQPGYYILMWFAGNVRSDTTPWTSRVAVYYEDQNSNSGTVYINDSENAELNSYDKNAHLAAMSNSSPTEVAAVVYLEAPGFIILSSELSYGQTEGEITVQPYQIFTADNLSGARIPIVENIHRRPDGTIIDSFGGDCPECPDCSQVVDCGEVNNTIDCPACPDDINITSLFPTSGPVAGGTQVTIVASGIDSTPIVKFGGLIATLQSFDLTVIEVLTPSSGGASGFVDVTVEMADGRSDVLTTAFEFVEDVGTSILE